MTDKPEWEYAGHQACKTEIERLRKDWDNLATLAAERTDDVEQLLRHRTEDAAILGRRDAEIGLLRAALQTIVDMEHGDDLDVMLDTADLRAVARSALNP